MKNVPNEIMKYKQLFQCGSRLILVHVLNVLYCFGSYNVEVMDVVLSHMGNVYKNQRVKL